MNIQDIREIMGLSQAQVADELGVPLQEVIDCEENGETYLLLQYISAFPINPMILSNPDVDPFLPCFDQGSPGQRMRRWREENHIPAETFAAALGLTADELSRMEESHELILSRRKGEEIERKTGINRKWLMYGDGRVKGASRLHAVPDKSAPKEKASRSAGAAPNKAAGNRLREAREAAGLTREELADLINLSVSRVAQMESGYIRDSKADHIIRRLNADSGLPEDPKAIGARIREVRKAAGLSVRDAAQIVRLKPSTLAHMESGYISSKRANELIAILQSSASGRGAGVFDPKEAGQLLRQERSKAGLSQKELATILRMPVPRIAHMELGEVTQEEYKLVLSKLHGKPQREIKVRRIKPTDQVILGSNIKELREAAGLSQKALGSMLRMPQTRISLIEKGKVDETTAKKILQLLNDYIDGRPGESENAFDSARKRQSFKHSRPDLGAEIQKKRTEAGLSQKALGDLMGLSQGSISYLEQGRVDEETAARALQLIKQNT